MKRNDLDKILKGCLDGKRKAQEQLFNRLFLSSRGPTAIVVCSGYMAMSVLQMLNRHDVKVPRDVSVCGYDDLRAFSFASPRLTTIRQPTEQIGRTAARQLMNLLEGERVRDHVLPVELVVRESTGPARKRRK